MANEIARQADQQKKKDAEPFKPVKRELLSPSSWLQSNAQEFVAWAHRVTGDFATVDAAMFDSIKAAFAALAPADQAAVIQATRGKSDLGLLLQSPSFEAFDAAR
jgi:hypothetical protein